MQSVEQVLAVAGRGLKGDRYFAGEGSYSQGKVGKRQVTLMNARFFRTTDKAANFTFADSRRNIFTDGVELMWLIGREFYIGAAGFRGIKYCDPCKRPSHLAGLNDNFADVFHDVGGLVAEVVVTGLIRVNDSIITPPKGY
ncbi:MAG TPA: hypothetical protein VLK22_00160 [Candidatus Udaeobacter sp.]|nr:hypothetical protein [Candidatus Udaeobacter sp.]